MILVFQTRESSSILLWGTMYLLTPNTQQTNFSDGSEVYILMLFKDKWVTPFDRLEPQNNILEINDISYVEETQTIQKLVGGIHCYINKEIGERYKEFYEIMVEVFVELHNKNNTDKKSVNNFKFGLFKVQGYDYIDNNNHEVAFKKVVFPHSLIEESISCKD